jgi:hypothetical protein
VKKLAVKLTADLADVLDKFLIVFNTTTSFSF